MRLSRACANRNMQEKSPTFTANAGDLWAIRRRRFSTSNLTRSGTELLCDSAGRVFSLVLGYAARVGSTREPAITRHMPIEGPDRCGECVGLIPGV